MVLGRAPQNVGGGLYNECTVGIVPSHSGVQFGEKLFFACLSGQSVILYAEWSRLPTVTESSSMKLHILEIVRVH